MFGWLRKKKEEKIERWKSEAKTHNARYLVVTFDSWDKFERPVFDMKSTTAIEAMLAAAPCGTLKWATNVFQIWEPKIEKETVECPKCGELAEV